MAADGQLVKKLGGLRTGGVAKNGFTISSIIRPTTSAETGSVTRLSSSVGSFTRSKSCAGTQRVLVDDELVGLGLERREAPVLADDDRAGARTVRRRPRRSPSSDRPSLVGHRAGADRGPDRRGHVDVLDEVFDHRAGAAPAPPGGRTSSGTRTAPSYSTHFDIKPWSPPISPWSLV